MFSEADDNFAVYDRAIKSMLAEGIGQGYNVTVLTYGQTGAGKSYTLFGDAYKNQQMGEGFDG